MNKYLYEKYHSHRKLQRKILSKNNFTYANLLPLLNLYTTKKCKILDIGCGTGALDFYLVKNFDCEILGIDISKNAVRAAKLNATHLEVSKNVKFLVQDFTKTTIRRKFDMVICSEVLEHLKNDKLSVKKIYTHLNKNGILIASSPSLNAPLYKLGYLKKFDKDVGHLRRYTIYSFQKLFVDCGFVVLESKKTEGILRNFLFTNNYAGKLIRFIKGPIGGAVSFIDNLTIELFGESQIFIVAKKI